MNVFKTKKHCSLGRTVLFNFQKILFFVVWCDIVLNIMKIEGLNISPVNMEDRKKLGVSAGDTVRVWVKIQEKGKTRTQAFEGLVLATKHGSEPGATFTVRKVSQGVGIERIFPLYSPNIDKIEIVKRAKVRRAMLYHIREKVAKEIKRQMRKMKMMNMSSLSDAEEEARKVKEAEEVEAKAQKEAESKEETTTEPTADSNEDIKEDSSSVSASDSEAVQEDNSEDTPIEEVKEEKVEEATEEVKEEEKKEE